MSEILVQETTSTSTARRKNTLPTREEDILMVLSTMIPQMEADKIELRWLPTSELKEKYQTFRTLIENKTGARSTRKPQSHRLRELNAIINEQIEYVKNLIIMKYRKENAVVNYPKFGIEKTTKGYKLPLTMESRAEALKTLVKELENQEWLNDTDGAGFWIPIRDEYIELTSGSYTGAGNISVMVGNKQALRKELNLAMVSVKSIIKGQFPDEYTTRWRIYGFQRERF